MLFGIVRWQLRQAQKNAKRLIYSTVYTTDSTSNGAETIAVDSAAPGFFMAIYAATAIASKGGPIANFDG